VVTLQDLREDPAVECDLLQDSRVSAYFGKNPDDIVSDFDILVLSPGIAADLPFVTKARAHGVEVLGEMELASAHCAAPIIAITGTNGKTTTTSIVGEIMQAYNSASRVVGNIGIPFCGVAEDVPPNAYVVAESSSFQLETIRNFHPKISAVLNMTEDHLDRHKTMENYVAAKERIFENQGANDYCVLNYDNEYTRPMAAKTGAQVIFFSMSPLDSGVYVQNDAICINWDRYSGQVIKTAELPIPGRHNLENAMAAVAISAAAGVPLDTISQCLRDFKAVEHRLEFVRELGGVHFYNDSKATNPDSAIKGLDAMTRPVILIGGGQDKGLDYGPWIDGFAGKVKHFIIIGQVAQKLEQTCRDRNFAEYQRADTMEDAVKLAFAGGLPGDCVLLSPACASFGMFDNFEHRGRAFKKIVMEL
ncbi:MAG: UDP-N-acetylmuramoyl-L-alanine--D-glutamate ligase, partial [Defluviitaleaceae bacterium]|nr:UDP-N-acetylmuramoyl-L-alanine--D-glutamate ligase [Defluviitaleaceae bacterium]